MRLAKLTKLTKLIGACGAVAIMIAAACTSAAYASVQDADVLGLRLAAPFSASTVSLTPAEASGELVARETAALIHEGVPPARASKAIDVEGEIAQTELVRKLSASANAYGGVWFEPAAAQMYIGVTSPAGQVAAERLIAREGLTGDVTTTPVGSTWAQLLATQKRWNHRLARLFARAQVETSLVPQRNAVAVTLASSVSSRERTVLKHEASTSNVNVLVTVVHYPQLWLIPDSETKCKLFVQGADEAYCDKPITAGVVIESRNNLARCTAGPLAVPVADKSRTYLLTAGHCIQDGLRDAKWFAWVTAGGARREIGQAARQYVNGLSGDVGAINVSRNGMWVEPGNPPVFAVTAEWKKAEEKSFPVKGERAPMVGATNCVEGRVSGGTCGSIKNVGVTFGGSEGLVEEQGGAISAKGDSGGPVIAETKGEYLVEGIDLNHTPKNNAIWEPLGTALSLLSALNLNLELLTTANEVRPGKESAKEKEENEKYEQEEKEGAEKVEKEENEELRLHIQTALPGELYPLDLGGSLKSTSELRSEGGTLVGKELSILLAVTEMTVLGTAVVDFLGVEEPKEKTKCHTPGDSEANGAVLVPNAQFRLVYTNLAPLELAAMILFTNLEIECNAGLLETTITGPLMMSVSVPKPESGKGGDSTGLEIASRCASTTTDAQEISSYYNEQLELVLTTLLANIAGTGNKKACELVTGTTLVAPETGSAAAMFSVLF